ncbi:peptidylprolyl isomerase [Intestinibacter bartlettii]|uniref:Peptidylprolyl isomerase n=1 Tax=Intestinibacter bartlettii TaxID=261299 RepID=A0ABS6DY39_9FIRM|nr:peptidylprolyl isomerase [Intestinibacter bartlettii]MBU5336318.1 peptidylprolyl isomerase [Intestinibacter bartlettii]
MKKIMAVVLSFVLGISMIGCSSNKNVATVNGEGIPAKYFETYVNWTKLVYETNYGYTSSVWNTEMEDSTDSSDSKNNKDSKEKQTYWDSFKSQMLLGMEQSEVVYQKAKEVKAVPSDDEVQEQVDNFKKNVNSNDTTKEQAEKAGINDEFLKYVLTRELAYSAYQEYFNKNTKVDESKLKKEYEEHKDSYDTVTASHILISTLDDQGNELSDAKKAEAKKKAEEVLEKAKSGEDFAKLAKEYSDDTANASEGGNLGAFTAGQMVEEFSDAAFALDKNEISDIVETQYGYHIIKVTDKADTYKAVKDSVKSAVLANEFTQQVEKLVKDAKIETNDEVLKSVSYK